MGKGGHRRRRNEWGRINEKKLSGGRSQFYARYIGPDNREHTAGRGFGTRQDAQFWLLGQKRLIDLDTWTPPAEQRAGKKAASLTVAGLIEKHLEQLNIKASTRDTYTRVLTNRILEPAKAPGAPGLPPKAVTGLAATPVVNVTRARAREWWFGVCDYYGVQEFNHKAYVLLRAAFNRAVEDELLEVNPIFVAEVAKTKPAKLEKHTLTEAEVRAILQHMSGRYWLVAALALWCGIRIGEALALEAKHVKETPAGVEVHICQNVQRIRNGRAGLMLMTTPKTEAGNRRILVPGFIGTPLLEAARAAKKRPPVVVPSDNGPARLYPLCVTSSGRIPYDGEVRKMVGRAAASAGIEGRANPHGGRTFANNRLMAAGLTPAAVGRYLGQKDKATILNNYHTATDAEVERAVAALEPTPGI